MEPQCEFVSFSWSPMYRDFINLDGDFSYFVLLVGAILLSLHISIAAVYNTDLDFKITTNQSFNSSIEHAC